MPRTRVRLDEVWKSVPDYDGLEVSSLGRVKKNGEFLKQYKNNWDYCYVWVGPGISKSVHSLVCEAFVGPKPSLKHEVNHDNGHKDDNYFENLFWATRSQNMKHAFATGLHVQKKGASNPDAKEYYFQSPNGKLVKVKGIRQFCREHGLDAGHMIKVFNGETSSHKGWRVGNIR